MYKLGSFQKRDNLPYWLFFIFKKNKQGGANMNKGGANLNSLGTTLKKCRRFEKIIKICGAYNKKHCVKKL